MSESFDPSDSALSRLRQFGTEVSSNRLLPPAARSSRLRREPLHARCSGSRGLRRPGARARDARGQRKREQLVLCVTGRPIFRPSWAGSFADTGSASRRSWLASSTAFTKASRTRSCRCSSSSATWNSTSRRWLSAISPRRPGSRCACPSSYLPQQSSGEPPARTIRDSVQSLAPRARNSTWSPATS